MASPEETNAQRHAPFGLVGRQLSHSWSKQIHEQLGSAPYAHHEVEPDDLVAFMREGSWKGINVTIPYKADAARLADVRSPRVVDLGVANTLIRQNDGTIFAENTDVLGFGFMLDRFCDERLGAPSPEVLARGEVLVLGSGGASKAVVSALVSRGAHPRVISRQGADTYNNLLERHAEARLVVNTTPVGMFPNCPASALTEEHLDGLAKLEGILDVVYNPQRTGLVLAAERRGIPAESGLGMLVAQAFFASELFQGRDLDPACVPLIESRILSQMHNIVLIGMPGAGKTACGKRLGRLLGRPFVDIDDAITTDYGMSAAEIIERDGEDAFRVLESEVTGRYCARSGLVIACGGGVVCRESNYALLHQNSTIVLIDRPLDQLATHDRPLTAAKGVEQLAAERMGTYLSWADVHLRCAGSALADAKALVELLGLGRA